MSAKGGIRQRVITALLITPCAIALILLTPTIALAAIIAGLCLVASWEWTRLAGMRSRPLRAVLMVFCALLMIVLWLRTRLAVLVGHDRGRRGLVVHRGRCG